jgi:hypothetical protein
MRSINTRIEIIAPVSQVWTVLTRFDRYPSWNPFITNVSGQPREGEQLQVHIQPPGKSGMTFRPTVLTMVPATELTWLGHFFLPGLLDGKHRFSLEALGGRCRFRQSEQFSGLLVPLISEKTLAATELGFEAMNAALKREVEGAVSESICSPKHPSNLMDAISTSRSFDTTVDMRTMQPTLLVR